MVDRIRKSEKSGTEDVMVAGDPEKKIFKQRSKEGIPVDDKKFDELIAISKTIKTALIK
jgi:LDH2 family malate/lactate/ureidoglycolate dehydrogenase